MVILYFIKVKCSLIILNTLPGFLYILVCLLLCSNTFSQSTSDKNTVTTSIAPGYDSVGKVHRFLFGEGYRKLWAAPVPIKVLDLKKEKGGLTILQKGGGLQTKSLRLKDASGKEYVLRSIQKYPERGLPENLRKTVARDILQDQVITSHPYAALTIPPLAEALGIAHSSPQIVYIPNDPALGEYQQEFANSVLLFEEREPVGYNETDNTEKVQRKLEDDNDYTIDQQKILRARLLDLILGDWDRHEDQWRWEVQKTKDKTVYSPIPRDRDKAYYSTSGIFPVLLSNQWLKANLQDFEEEILEIEVYNYNNRYFDRYFLNQLTEADWRKEIALVKSKLTDSLISASIHLLPDTIFAISGQRIIKVLMGRRDKLDKQALKYYRFLARFPDVPATTKDEQITVDFKTNSNVEVMIRNIKKDSTIGKVLFQRTFVPETTNEVRLYGLDGNDQWIVKGDGLSPIKIRLVGGASRDSFYVARMMQKNKLYVYDRRDQDNIFNVNGPARFKLSNDSTVNTFNRKSFVYDQHRKTGSAFFNPDQGFLLRVGYIIENQGFRKSPYASKHLFYINYATLWKSIMFTYNGSFKKALGNNDLSVDFISRGPFNVDNFYGTGNESILKDRKEETRKFFQNQYDLVRGEVRLQRELSPVVKFSVGSAVEFYTSASSDNVGKFLTTYNTSYPDERIFSDQFFTGLVAGISINTKDRSLVPYKGIEWKTDVRSMQQLNGFKNWYMNLFSSFDFYIPIKNSDIVIANRIAGGTNFGYPAFYQQHRLGGPLNLRGYTLNRFTGKSVFYNNVELRIKLFDFTSYISPGSFGLIGFNDVGRVWIPKEKSTTWHSGTGGGIYIIPAELIVIQGLVGFSDEGTYPYFSIGFRF